MFELVFSLANTYSLLVVNVSFYVSCCLFSFG